MQKSEFSIRLADLEREQNIHREWELSKEWLTSALGDTEAKAGDKVGRATLDFFMNGREVVVRGKLEARVELPCARTLDPAVYDLQAELFVVLKKAPETSAAPSRTAKQMSAKQRRQEEEGQLLSDEDAASDTFDGDKIAVDRFIREQLVLELPMFPLRSDLRSQDAPAMRPPSNGSGPKDSEEVDPRLLPLKAIADKLKSKN